MPDAYSLLHQTTAFAARHFLAVAGLCLVVASQPSPFGRLLLCPWAGWHVVDQPAGDGGVGARALARVPPLAREDWSTLAQRADAIVVLGSGRERGDPAWGADQPTGIGLERQRYAARLAKASGLPVLTTGGLHYGTPPSEAQLMAVSMQDDFGRRGALKEERSRTTWETLK